MSRIKDLAAYVRNNVEFFGLQLALNKMEDRLRCPLSFADEELYNDIIADLREDVGRESNGGKQQ